MALLDALQHSPAVHARHHHVEKDELRLLLALEHRHSVVRGACVEHGVALELEARAHVLAHAVVVVDHEHRRARVLPRARTRALEELVEVRTAVAPMATRRIEGGDASVVRPLPDRALSDAEVLGGLAEGQPVGLGGGRSVPGEVAVGHTR